MSSVMVLSDKTETVIYLSLEITMKKIFYFKIIFVFVNGFRLYAWIDR